MFKCLWVIKPNNDELKRDKENMIMKKYNIEVDCANCAAKMEEAVKKVAGIKEVNVAFMAQKMSIEFEEGADEKKIMKEVVKACSKVDSDFDIEL